MNSARRIVPWLGRFVLLAAAVIFTLIGLRYLFDPAGAAREFQTSFGSAAGATSMRVGFGAFPLAFAGILAFCLVSSRRRLFGLGMVATIMGLATGARLLGIALDGPAPQSSMLLAPEIVMTALSSFCAAFEWSTRRGAAPVEPEARDRAAADPGRDRLRRRVGSALVVGLALALAGSSIAKLVGVTAIATHLGALGFTGLVPLIGVLELTSATLLAFSLTRPAGLLMASAFLGGAIATHLQHGLSPVPAAVPLALLWLGAWLRHPELVSGALSSSERRAIGAAPQSA